MANVIDTSYFVGDIEIPNIAQPEISTDVTNSIKVFEKEVLIALLGYPMWKDLQAALASPVSGDKWDKLLNGGEFTFSFEGEIKTRYWEGLKGLEKKSLIAYFVYFMHRRKRATYMSGVNTEVEADSENSTRTTPIDRLIYVWNEFLDMYGDSCSEGQHENDAPSAYNYILAKTADFPNWEFKSQGRKINRFGI
jgi:hypothetical protein